MEFKYQAIGERQSSFTPQYSNYSYFTDQAFRDGNLAVASQFRPRFGRFDEYNQMPTEKCKAILWEVEKEKIRAETIAEEITRLRALEAKERPESMIERELEMQRGFGGFHFPSAPDTARFEPYGLAGPHLPHRDGKRPVEGLNTLSLEQRIGISALVKQYGRFDSTSIQPRDSRGGKGQRIPEVKLA